MKSAKKNLIVSGFGVVTATFFFYFVKTYNINMITMLLSMMIFGLVVASFLIIKAHINQELLNKRFFSNTAGACIDLALYSFVMLIVWVVFSKNNILYQAVLILYPLIKAADTFISNKFKSFMHVFVFYKKFENHESEKIKNISQNKAKAKKILKHKK